MALWDRFKKRRGRRLPNPDKEIPRRRRPPSAACLRSRPQKVHLDLGLLLRHCLRPPGLGVPSTGPNPNSGAVAPKTFQPSLQNQSQRSPKYHLNSPLYPPLKQSRLSWVAGWPRTQDASGLWSIGITSVCSLVLPVFSFLFLFLFFLPNTNKDKTKSCLSTFPMVHFRSREAPHISWGS